MLDLGLGVWLGVGKVSFGGVGGFLLSGGGWVWKVKVLGLRVVGEVLGLGVGGVGGQHGPVQYGLFDLSVWAFS